MGDLDNGVREIRESWAAYQDIGEEFYGRMPLLS